MKILLDNGHGINTHGKRSPIMADGSQVLEYKFNREIVNEIAKGLADRNIPFAVLVPEITDVPLDARVRRINTYAKKEKCLLISIHANAGGGSGFEVFTTPGQNNSDLYAEIIAEEFKKEFPSEKLRTDFSDKDLDKEANFQIIKGSLCPAVLTENFFMDNIHDYNIISSEEGKRKIAKYHINALNRIYYGL